MTLTEKELHILQWIQKVSEIRKELKGFAICPFASTSKYKIIECSVSEIEPIDGYDVIIFIIEDDLNLNSIQSWVNFYNQKYKTWKFFEDCGSYDTYIQEIQTNNGKYNLILSQPSEKLQKFRKKLAKTDYYNLWDENYLHEILENDYDIIRKG